MDEMYSILPLLLGGVVKADLTIIVDVGAERGRGELTAFLLDIARNMP